MYEKGVEFVQQTYGINRNVAILFNHLALMFAHVVKCLLQVIFTRTNKIPV